MSYRYLREREIPAWYVMTYDPGKKAFYFSVRKDAANREPIPFNAWIVGHLRETFEVDIFTDFHGGFGDYFGFGESMRRCDESERFITYEAKVPKVMKVKANRDACIGPVYDRYDSSILGLSIMAFFRHMAEEPEVDGIDPGFAQPVGITTERQQGKEGCSLGGVYGKSFVLSLPELFAAAGFRKEVEATVLGVWMHMMRLDPDDYEGVYVHQVRVEGEKGSLCINTIGDRTGIYPSNPTGELRAEAYEFSCHNVDVMDQQLSLLAGIGFITKRYLDLKGITL